MNQRTGAAVGTAAGIAGGTAGAIAASPFRGPDYRGSYACDRNPNGFVCQPGTWFSGEDGPRHPCQ